MSLVSNLLGSSHYLAARYITMRTRQAILALSVCVLGSTWAQAVSQSTESLRDLVATHLQQRYSDEPYPVEIDISTVDPRMVLAPCSHTPQVQDLSHNSSAARRLLRVSCSDDQARWHIHVGAHVTRYRDVLVAARSIARGSPINTDAVTVERKRVDRLLQGYFEKPSTVLGYTARSAIQTGSVLSPRVLAAPKLIRRGQDVVIRSAGQRIKVRAKGTALNDAALGDVVRVKNASSGKVISGVAAADGDVVVNF